MYPHEYNFDCKCKSCSCITKHFHFTTKKQAKDMGFDLTEDKPREQTIEAATKGMYYEDIGGLRRYPNICNTCEVQFDCRVNAETHCHTVHPDEVAYITTWVIMK